MPRGPLFTALPVALALPTCDGCEQPVPSASLIGRRAERPANEEKRHCLDGESVTAGAGRAAALDRAASRAIAVDMVCSSRKLGRATG